MDDTHDNEQHPINETPTPAQMPESMDIQETTEFPTIETEPEVTEVASVEEAIVLPDEETTAPEFPGPETASLYEIESDNTSDEVPLPATQKLYPWELMGGEESTPQDIVATMNTEPEPATPVGANRSLVVIIASLGILIILVGAFSLKLWSDRVRAQQALRTAVTVVSGNAGLDPVGIRNLNEAVDKGNFAEVAGKIEKMAQSSSQTSSSSETAMPGMPSPLSGMPSTNASPQSPGRMRGGSNRTGMPSAADSGVQNQVPPEVMKFFEKHKDLANTLAQGSMAAAQLKARGGDVSKLRQIRDEIFSAARLEDAKHVGKLLDDFRKEFDKQARKLMGVPASQGMMRGPRGGGMPGQMPGRMPSGAGGRTASMPPHSLIVTGQEAEHAIQKAQMAGKDIRPAIQLIQKAQAAGRSGNFTLAQSLVNQARSSAQSAKPIPAQPKLFDNPLVSMLMGLIQNENVELQKVMTSLRQAWDSRKTATVDSLADTTRQAVDKLTAVNERRSKFGAEIERIRTGGKPALTIDRKAIEAEQKKRLEDTKKAIGDLLVKMRTLSPEDFAAQRDKFIEDILAVVFNPQPQAVKPGADTDKPPVQPTTPAEELTREKVQGKLLQAAVPYLELCKDPNSTQLTDQLSGIFAQARKELAAGKFAEADKLADEGLKLLGLDKKAPTDARTTSAGAPVIENKETP